MNRTTATNKGKFWRLAMAATMLSISLSPLFLSPLNAVAHGDDLIIEGVPSVRQSLSLNCEYAAVAAVTLFWGDAISQFEFISEIPSNPNPHKGFRGDIKGEVGGIDDYGIYPEAIVPALERRGYDATPFYGKAGRLKSEIEQGHPIIAWITSGKNETRPVYRKTYGGETFKLVPYEHTVVVYGYNSEGVYLMDVGDGGRYFTEWASFLRRWSYFDNMALLIHPR